MWLSDMSVRRPRWRSSSVPCSPCSAWWPSPKLTVREMPDVQTPSVSITTTTYEGRPRGDGSQVTKPIGSALRHQRHQNINSVTRKAAPPSRWSSSSWNMLEGTSDVRRHLPRPAGLPDEADEPMVTKDSSSGDVAIWLNFSSTQMDPHRHDRLCQPHAGRLQAWWTG